MNHLHKVIFVLVSFLLTNIIYPCSGVFIANDEVKLLGLNEDYWDYNTFYRTLPGTATEYGIIGFGHSNSIQAIINEKGLCYDGYGAPHKEVTLNNHLPENNGSFIFQAMRTCKNVSEVVALYNKNFHPWLSNSQIFFADRAGNAVIIEGDTLIYKTGDYQICTNFYQSDPECGRDVGFYPCRRYSLLQNELENTDDYSIDFVRNLLDSVHIENQQTPNGPNSTVYSLIIDLKLNEIHVFNLYNFDESIILNIEEELSKSSYQKTLNSLFPTDIKEDVEKPNSIELNQNYPNPFNPTTTISYHIPEKSNVRLKIFDIRGKLIRLYEQKSISSGFYSIHWDGTGNNLNSVSSGVYIYSLEVSSLDQVGKSVSMSKKLLLLK